MRCSPSPIPVAAVLMLLAVASTPAAAVCVSYEDYLHPLGSYVQLGYPTAIAYQEPYLYVADDIGSLTVVDASDPAFMEEVATVTMPAPAHGLVVVKSIAYCVLDNRLLQLVDLADPHAPTLLGSTSFQCTPTAVAAAGDFAYVSAWQYGEDNHGIYVVDVSDPQAPIICSRTEVEPFPMNIVISGRYAYTLDSYGLSILDLASPKEPVLVGQLDLQGGGRYLTVRDGLTYVVCSGEEYPAPGNGLYILNTAQPEMPFIVGSLTGEDAPAFGIGVWDDYALIGHSPGGIALINISDPQHPKLAHHVGVQDVPYDYVVSGSVLFARSDVVMSYLLQQPFAPEPVAVVPGLEGMVSTATDGTYAYVVEYEEPRLHVLDMSNPQDPRIIGSTEIDAQYVYGIAVTDPGTLTPHAYVGGQRTDDEIYVLDISDPTMPRQVNTLTVPHWSSDLDVEGQYLYVPCGAGELSVYDISAPDAPQFVSSVDFTYNVQVVKAVGTTLYVGQRLLYHYGLYVVDASDPHDLEIITQSTAPRRPYEFWAEGSLLYVADGDQGFLIMDVSDPHLPLALGRLRTLQNAQSVVVDGGVGYVADWQTNSGVQAIDVTDPAVPHLIGYFPADRPSELELLQGGVLIATQHGPLAVMPFECGSPSGVEGPRVGGPAASVSISGNPARGEVAFRLDLARSSSVSLDLFDLQGRAIRRFDARRLASGLHPLIWDGRDDCGLLVSPGAYFYLATTEEAKTSGRLVLVR